MKQWLGFCGLIFLTACQQRTDFAPVVEARPYRQFKPSPISYIVKSHDTLYAIAFRYDKDYRLLAAINRLYPPYRLNVGQRLRLEPYTFGQLPISHQRSFMPLPQKATRIQPQRITKSNGMAATSLRWPTRQRKIIRSFSPAQGRKGIDILGYRGDKIYAGANGIVAYAGDGLTGYGNLIIIKHNHQLLTAYGHNSRNLVREGQVVRTGQVIAEMGRIDRNAWGVHFETRVGGKPVNPLSYLK